MSKPKNRQIVIFLKSKIVAESMFSSRQPTNILVVSGVIIFFWIFSIQWATVSTAVNHSEKELSSRTELVNQTLSLIESKPAESKTTKRTTTKATKTTTKKPPTTKAVRFLDDYGILPGEPYDDDDDDNDDKTFGLLSTEIDATTVKIPIQKRDDINAVLSRAQRSLEYKRSASESAKSKGTTGSNVNATSSTSTNRTKNDGNDIKPSRKRHIRDTDNHAEIINPASTKLETKNNVTKIPTSPTARIDGTYKPNRSSKRDGQFPGKSKNATASKRNGLGIMPLGLADAIGRPQQQSLDTSIASTETDEGSGEVTEESTKITIRTTDITTAEEEESTTTTKPTTSVATTEIQESTATTKPTTSITTEMQQSTATTKPTTSITTEMPQSTATTKPTTSITTTEIQESTTTTKPTTSITTEMQQSTATTKPTTIITTTEIQESTTTTKPTTSVVTTVTQELTTITKPTTSDATTKTPELTTMSTTATSSTSTTTTPRTTASTAAATRSTTTPSPIDATKPPKYDDVKGNVSMVFDIIIQIVFDIQLDDPTSGRFKDLAYEVEISVNIAFFNCPGFIKNSAKVKRFIQVSVVLPGRVSLDGPLPLADNQDLQTQADYDVLFENAKVVSDPVSVSNYIAQTVAPALQSTGVGNYTVSTASMAQAANEQVANFTSDVCSIASCDPCYACKKEAIENSTANQASCAYDCNIKNQRCTIVNNTLSTAIGQCTCMTGYLPVGSGCTDQNVIIGVTVAVASAVLLGLLIAVMMLGYRAVIATRKLKYSKSDESSVVSEADERIENQDMANRRASDEQGYLNSQSTTTPEEEYRGGETDDDDDADDDNDYDDNIIPAELVQSEVYKTFVPNLISVTSEDLSKKYSIARPRIGQKSLDKDMDIYQYASYF